jgi:Spondin_N
MSGRTIRWGVIGLLLATAVGCGRSSPSAPGPVDPAAPAPPPSSDAATARYRVTFRATWSRGTHPTDFPSNPHFSPLVGGTHGDAVTFWRGGALATEGIRRMAELGSQSPLDEEVRAAVDAGLAQFVLRGGGIPLSPGEASLEFDVTRDYPLVTLVSMIAPSPDWFVGVSGLPLRREGAWRDEIVVDLLPWDAGTDIGRTFTSPDAAASPRQSIDRITGAPLGTGGGAAPLGTFVFQRLRP